MLLFQTNYDTPLMTVALFSFLAVVVYFMPMIIAMARSHHKKKQIILLNIFAGWTIIGWIGALVWSLMAVHTAHEIRRQKRLKNLQN